MERTVTVIQPSYIPWRGYFDLIRRAETFVFYDDVQYDKHGWRNRNRIKTASGPLWLTIPVLSKGSLSRHALIKDIEIDERSDWRQKHLQSIRHAYHRAPFFEDTFQFLNETYADRRSSLLSDFTMDLTKAIAARLNLRPEFVRSSELGVSGERMDRLMGTLAATRAGRYISGPSAQAYIDEGRFRASGIALEYIDYTYGVYPQLHGDFDPNVSIVDLLMMTGPSAADHIVPVTAPENLASRQTSP